MAPETWNYEPPYNPIREIANYCSANFYAFLNAKDFVPNSDEDGFNSYEREIPFDLKLSIMEEFLTTYGQRALQAGIRPIANLENVYPPLTFSKLCVLYPLLRAYELKSQIQPEQEISIKRQIVRELKSIIKPKVAKRLSPICLDEIINLGLSWDWNSENFLDSLSQHLSIKEQENLSFTESHQSRRQPSIAIPLSILFSLIANDLIAAQVATQSSVQFLNNLQAKLKPKKKI